MTWPDGRAPVDGAVFVYALGQPHPLREACRAIVGALGESRARAVASVEAAREVSHSRWRRTGDRAETVRRGWQVHALVEVHGCGDTELRRALELFAASERLQLRDAVHAATALLRGVPAIISPDDDVDDVDGVDRLDPRDAAARL